MSQPAPPMPHQQSTIRPRVRARRGQATDPHSIAERLRRERIAERIRSLQELVPTVNKVGIFFSRASATVFMSRRELERDFKSREKTRVVNERKVL
jgi:hypothetical protein